MFVISKIITFFLNPFLWIVLFLMAAWISRNTSRKKSFLKIALFLFIFFSNSYLPKYIWYHYQAPFNEMKAGEKYSCGILLGGFVSYDDKNNQPFFNPSSDRFIQAVRLYKQGHISKIIMTGGNALFIKDKEYREADYVVKNLVEFGIPSTDILTERNAKNTIENSKFSNRILDSAHVPGPYVLITSALHMPRAVKIFSQSGLTVRPYPCDFRVLESDIEFTWQSLLPSSSSFDQWGILMKEFVGTLSLGFRQH